MPPPPIDNTGGSSCPLQAPNSEFKATFEKHISALSGGVGLIYTEERVDKQKNFYSRLHKRERKTFYSNLDPKFITDKLFWKTIKPFLSDKGCGTSNITLIDDKEILTDDLEVAKKTEFLFRRSSIQITYR